MITVFVKHSGKCKSKDRYYKRCNCRKWLYNPDWTPDPRKSAKTRSWEKAELLARKLDTGEAKITMGEAVTQFLTDKRNQQVSGTWVGKFKLLLEGWAEDRELSSITLADLEKFRDNWTGVAITKRKKQERLVSFFHYCVKHRWIAYNVAKDLSRIKVPDKPTLPLSREQYRALLDSCGEDVALRTCVLLMRHSGLRIRDAICLGPDRMNENKVFLYTQKTGVPVWVPVPPGVAKEIRGHLPLYRGGTSLKRRLNVFQAKFQARGVHSHQLRDTFAVEFLSKDGNTIEMLSRLLGHSDPKITFKHYSPWVIERQQQLEQAVMRTWS